jgi:hypothetical protein
MTEVSTGFGGFNGFGGSSGARNKFLGAIQAKAFLVLTTKKQALRMAHRQSITSMRDPQNPHNPPNPVETSVIDAGRRTS